MIEIYAVELKRVSKVDNNEKEEALNPRELQQKWKNCLDWALDVVQRFNSVRQGGFNICNYVVLVVPEEVRNKIATLIGDKIYMYLPKPTVGRIQGRLLSCNTPITGKVDIF